ncbi:MAG: hypothetical protein ACOCQD_02845 [archaeon]
MSNWLVTINIHPSWLGKLLGANKKMGPIEVFETLQDALDTFQTLKTYLPPTRYDIILKRVEKSMSYPVMIHDLDGTKLQNQDNELLGQVKVDDEGFVII